MDSLILVDVLDAHGHLVSRQRLSLAVGGPPISIGRDVTNDVIVDDPYAAPRHAELSLCEDGSLRMTDASEMNGIIVRGERMRGARLVALPGGTVGIGRSTLRIRSARDPVPPETPDLESLQIRHREYSLAIAGALLCIAYGVFTVWLSSPDDFGVALGAKLLLGAAVLGGVLLFWILAARFRRFRARWSRHAGILLPAVAVFLWLGWAADVAVFATGEKLLGALAVMLQLVVVALALHWHLRTVTALSARVSALVAWVVVAICFGGYGWYAREQVRGDVNYMAPVGRVFPPSWSIPHGMSADTFIDEAVILRDAADAKRAEALE